MQNTETDMLSEPFGQPRITFTAKCDLAMRSKLEPLAVIF